MTPKKWLLLFKIDTVFEILLMIGLFLYRMIKLDISSGYEALAQVFYIFLDFSAILCLLLSGIFLCIGCIKKNHICLLLGIIFQLIYGFLYAGFLLFILLLFQTIILSGTIIGGCISFVVSILFIAGYFCAPSDKHIE